MVTGLCGPSTLSLTSHGTGLGNGHPDTEHRDQSFYIALHADEYPSYYCFFLDWSHDTCYVVTHLQYFSQNKMVYWPKEARSALVDVSGSCYMKVGRTLIKTEHWVWRGQLLDASTILGAVRTMEQAGDSCAPHWSPGDSLLCQSNSCSKKKQTKKKTPLTASGRGLNRIFSLFPSLVLHDPLDKCLLRTWPYCVIVVVYWSSSLEG